MLIIGKKMRQFILTIAIICANTDLTDAEKICLIEDELKGLKYR